MRELSQKDKSYVTKLNYDLSGLEREEEQFKSLLEEILPSAD